MSLNPDLDDENIHPLFIEWLKKEIGTETFSDFTWMFIRTGLWEYDIHLPGGWLEPEEQQAILKKVRNQIAWEKRVVGGIRGELEQQIRDAANKVGEGDAVERVLATTREQPIQAKIPLQLTNAEGKKPQDEPRVIPAALKYFDLEEREGIAAISAYNAFLLGCLPQVQAFRGKYLQNQILSTPEARRLLASPVFRYFSSEDLDNQDILLTDHEAVVIDHKIEPMSPAKQKRLKGDFFVLPLPAGYHLAEKVRLWYLFTISISLTLTAANNKRHHQSIINKAVLTERSSIGWQFEPFLTATDYQGEYAQAVSTFFSEIRRRRTLDADGATNHIPSRPYP